MSTLVYSPLTEREYRNYKRKVRRQREIRNKLLLTIITLIVVLTAVLSLHSITSQAQEERAEVTYKYFTSHEVVSGDTLWNIALEHIDYDYYDCVQDYIDEVMDINNMSDATVKVGQNIVIPYFSNIYS